MNSLVLNLSSYLDKVARGEDKVLEPRQLETLEKIRDFLVAGHTEGHVTNPTGTGKTVIFSKFLEAVLNGSNQKALVVGATKINILQNRWKLDEFADLSAGAFYSHERDFSRSVTVTTYHSLRNAVKFKRVDPLEYAVLILDEAHRGLGKETIEAIESFEKAVKIGFTATPEFSEEHSVADLLPFTIDDMSVREAIESNLLAGLKVFVMTTGMSTEHVAVSGTDYDEVALSETLNTTDRNRFIAKLYLDKRFNGKRTVVYGASRVHAKALATMFEIEGIPAAYVDGLTPEAEREDILEKFKSGEIKVLCNVRVLVESFDEPEAEVCFNAAPTMSKVIAEQRGGRILRRSRVRDSKIGYVVEILDEFGTSANTPVLYSEIAGAAEILSPSNRKEEEKQVKTRKPKSDKVEPKKSAADKVGKVLDDPEVIMNLTNRNKRQRFTRMFEYAPRGWVYPRRLAHELHIKESDVRNFAEVHATDHGDWFRRYLTPLEILTGHYHPRLVALVRRRFDKRLEGMVTPAEYAEQMVTSEDRARTTLEAADVTIGGGAIRFEDESYFSTKTHRSIDRSERELARLEEALLGEDAEHQFWDDSECDDDRREQEYWSNFEPITSERFAVEPESTELPDDLLLHGEDVVEFDDDSTLPSWEVKEDELSDLGRSALVAVRKIVEMLPTNHCKVIVGRYFEDLTYREVAERIGLAGPERVRQLESKALNLLRSRGHRMYLWQHGAISYDMLACHYYSRPLPRHHDDTPDEAKRLLRKLEVDYTQKAFGISL